MRRFKYFAWAAMFQATFLSIYSQFWTDLFVSTAFRGMDSSTTVPSSDAAVSSNNVWLQGLENITKNMTIFSTGKHDPSQQRNCFAFTAVPSEINRLVDVVEKMLKRYDSTLIQCIHLSIPERAIRFQTTNYPSTLQLRKMFSDPRIILHRLVDYGPLTRYIGPIAYERHPDTAIVVFDMDSKEILEEDRYLAPLITASASVDTEATWCYGGEDFRYHAGSGLTTPVWDTYPSFAIANGYKFSLLFFCRAAGGLLVKPKHFRNFWYNQTAYHESCFWDDDRWVGFQMERQKIPMKCLSVQSIDDESARPSRRRRLGTLTMLNYKLQSKHTCTKAWMDANAESFPLARTNKISS